MPLEILSFIKLRSDLTSINLRQICNVKSDVIGKAEQ